MSQVRLAAEACHIIDTAAAMAVEKNRFLEVGNMNLDFMAQLSYQELI